MESESIYCAFDSLNPTINRITGEAEHACEKYGTYSCLKCNSRYDGDRIKNYMETHERIE